MALTRDKKTWRAAEIIEVRNIVEDSDDEQPETEKNEAEENEENQKENPEQSEFINPSTLNRPANWKHPSKYEYYINYLGVERRNDRWLKGVMLREDKQGV
jgi:hypothetical protein